MNNKHFESEYNFRRCEARDYQALNDAYNKFTGRSRTIEQYLWQWVKTPFEASESWVIEWLPTHEIVGHHGVMYLPFSQKGTPIPVGKTENTFVNLNHSRKLFYLPMEKKALDAMKDRFEYIFTTASDEGKGAVGLLRKRLGYVSVGKIALYSQNIKFPAARLLIKERFSQIGRVAPLLALGHSLVQWAGQSLNWFKSRHVKIIPLSWDRVDEVQTFWEMNKSYYGISPDRTASYLNWRFANNPYFKYSLIRLEIEKEVLGYAVVKNKNTTIGGSVFAISMIDDLIVSRADGNKFYLALAALSCYYGSSIFMICILCQNDALNFALNRFLGIVKKWHEIIGSDLLVWGRNDASDQWYFTNMMSEGRN